LPRRADRHGRLPDQQGLSGQVRRERAGRGVQVAEIRVPAGRLRRAHAQEMNVAERADLGE